MVKPLKSLKLPYAKIKNSNQDVLVENFSDIHKNNIICPYCLGDVNFRKGRRLKNGWKWADHFYHLVECFNRKVDTESESIQHKKAKDYFFKIFKEIFEDDDKFESILAKKEYLFKVGDIHRIADIYFKFKYDNKIYEKVVEIQFSNIPEEELLERHNDYKKLWVDDVWVNWFWYDKKWEIEKKYLTLSDKIASFQDNFIVFTNWDSNYIPWSVIKIHLAENIHYYVDKKYEILRK